VINKTIIKPAFRLDTSNISKHNSDNSGSMSVLNPNQQGNLHSVNNSNLAILHLSVNQP
jgi:hypothetical protein